MVHELYLRDTQKQVDVRSAYFCFDVNEADKRKTLIY